MHRYTPEHVLLHRLGFQKLLDPAEPRSTDISARSGDMYATSKLRRATTRNSVPLKPYPTAHDTRPRGDAGADGYPAVSKMMA